MRPINHYFDDIPSEMQTQSMDANSTDSEPYIGVISACFMNFKSFFLPLFANSPHKDVLQEVLLQIEIDRESR